MNKAEFNKDNIRTCVNANANECGLHGYFANNVYSLENAINLNKVNLNVIYTELVAVLERDKEHRFVTEYGNFALFYPLDKKFNKNRI